MLDPSLYHVNCRISSLRKKRRKRRKEKTRRTIYAHKPLSSVHTDTCVPTVRIPCTDSCNGRPKHSCVPMRHTTPAVNTTESAIPARLDAVTNLFQPLFDSLARVQENSSRLLVDRLAESQAEAAKNTITSLNNRGVSGKTRSKKPLSRRSTRGKR